MHVQAQRRHGAAVGQLITLLHGSQDVRSGQWVTDRRIVGAKMNRRPQLQTDRALALDQPVMDEDRVLHVRQQHALLEGHVADLVAPDRQAPFEAKLGKVLDTVQVELAADALLAAEMHGLAVRQPQPFREVIEHHAAPERARQRGDEQAVIAPRSDAGERAGSVAAQAVGHQPLIVDELLHLAGMLRRPRQVQDTVFHAARSSSYSPHPRTRGSGASGIPLLRHEHDRRLTGDAPAVRRLHFCHTGAAILALLARPVLLPALSRRWRE